MRKIRARMPKKGRARKEPTLISISDVFVEAVMGTRTTRTGTSAVNKTGKRLEAGEETDLSLP